MDEWFCFEEMDCLFECFLCYASGDVYLEALKKSNRKRIDKMII